MSKMSESDLKKKLCQNCSCSESKLNQEIESLEEYQQELPYDIIRIIFNFLNSRDLARAAMVCRCWRDTAAMELRTRGPAIFRESLEMDSDDCFSRVVKEVADNLRIKPRLGLIFVQTIENDDFEPVQYKMIECYCSKLPIPSETMLVRTRCPILENFNMDKDDAACIFFPANFNIERKIYCSDSRSLSSDIAIIYPGIERWLMKKIKRAKNVKSICLLTFTSFEGYRLISEMLKRVKRKYPKRSLSLIGGVVGEVRACKRSKQDSYCQKYSTGVLLILDGSNLQSWSIVIPEKCVEENDIEERLIALKQRIQLKKFTVAFIFACIARLDDKHVETKVFKKVFPDIPLIGGYGEGELGENTLKDASSLDTSCCYSYTTIFKILTYNN